MANLPGRVQPARPGLQGFDSDTVISLAKAHEFKQAGYEFAIRYLSLGPTQAPGDLSQGEAMDILRGGLALMPVQHVLAPGWTPSEALGKTHGANARDNAYRIGFPARVNIWLDLEGVHKGVYPAAVADYCNAWFAEVAQWGYLPGIYVGANTNLTADELYYLLRFSHYWKSASAVPNIPFTVYQLIQYAPFSSELGVSIDRDRTQLDDMGSRVMWLAP